MDYDKRQCIPQAPDNELRGINSMLRKEQEERAYKEMAGGMVGTVKGPAPGSSSDEVIYQAHTELNHQCCAAPLIDVARNQVRDAVFSQYRTQRAKRYLDLAARNPEVAEMIELARNL